MLYAKGIMPQRVAPAPVGASPDVASQCRDLRQLREVAGKSKADLTKDAWI